MLNLKGVGSLMKESIQKGAFGKKEKKPLFGAKSKKLNRKIQRNERNFG